MALKSPTECAFGYLIGKWPQWEMQISIIYNQRKKWFVENGQVQEQILAD